jgi:hypothetical protein
MAACYRGPIEVSTTHDRLIKSFPIRPHDGYNPSKANAIELSRLSHSSQIRAGRDLGAREVIWSFGSTACRFRFSKCR